MYANQPYKSVFTRFGAAESLRAALLVLLSGLLHAACLGRLDFDSDDTGSARDAGQDLPITPNDADDSDSNPFLDIFDGETHLADGDDAVDVEPVIPTVEALHRQVFAPSCAPCHTERASGGFSLRLRDELHTTLLAPSTQLPSMPRVAAGDLDGSYLWRKLNNSHEEAGGLGEQMPLSGAVTAEQLALLELWIVNGAPR